MCAARSLSASGRGRPSMAALNSKGHQAPFLTYLTVFKSRLATANLVLPMTGFAYQPALTLSRRLKEKLSLSVSLPLNDPAIAHILEYLVDKGLVGSAIRTSGRYTTFSLVKKNGRWV